MRFRPANISLINRRHYLPRLLLTLSSKEQMQKPTQRFEDVDRVTPYQGKTLSEIAVDKLWCPSSPQEVHRKAFEAFNFYICLESHTQSRYVRNTFNAAA